MKTTSKTKDKDFFRKPGTPYNPDPEFFMQRKAGMINRTANKANSSKGQDRKSK